jgi:hypothetical protein
MHFAVDSGEGISYRDPEPVSFVNHLGAFELADGKLTIAPVEHCLDEEEARRAIEQFLRAWEIDADLTSNLGMIRFTFERVELIDRDPPPWVASGHSGEGDCIAICVWSGLSTPDVPKVSAAASCVPCNTGSAARVSALARVPVRQRTTSIDGVLCIGAT